MGVLAVLAALPVAAALLVLLRATALRRAAAARPAVRPLAPGEILRLRRWERRVRRALLLVGLAYAGLVAASLAGGEPPPGRAAAALALLGAACLLAAAIQFSERCPHCRFNLGFLSRLALPESCERCGGPFR